MKKDSSLSEDLHNFVDEATIREEMARLENPESGRIREILAKAREKQGLDPEEAAAMLRNRDRDLDEAIYGNRLVVSAPLYITNECKNRCAYCGFKASNTELDRRTLSTEELKREVEVLENLGRKRLLTDRPARMEAGERDLYL
ncbi:MAG: radical SAM protein [Pseudodesulfovibrio sp.]